MTDDDRYLWHNLPRSPAPRVLGPQDGLCGRDSPVHRGAGVGGVAVTSRIDWSAVVGQMKATKLSLRGIARLTGLSTASIHNLAGGHVEPLHEHGERVIDAWRERTALNREQLPRIEMFKTLNGDQI